MDRTEKEVIFLINCMSGGGAERVICSLANYATINGWKSTIILTSQSMHDSSWYHLDSHIEKLSLVDLQNGINDKSLKYKVMSMYGHTIKRVSKAIDIEIPESVVYSRYVSDHINSIKALNCFFRNHPGATVVAFLDHSIQLALLSLKYLPNKLIVSERGDPVKHSDSKTASLFIKKYYDRVNTMVFQTEESMSYYNSDIQHKAVVIPNAIKQGLPVRFVGVRKKVVVNFCRISHQKNIPLLLHAFYKFHKYHPDYNLRIIGDNRGIEAEEVMKDCYKIMNEYNMVKSVTFLPFDSDVHCSIVDCAMFVSSSDYEGMSNSMLEAMAIGLPVVCTDCPSGGARAVIKDGFNGILTKPGDVDGLASAMSSIAENHLLAEKLSINATRISEELSFDIIMHKWISLY